MGERGPGRVAKAARLSRQFGSSVARASTARMGRARARLARASRTLAMIVRSEYLGLFGDVLMLSLVWLYDL